MVHDQLQLVEPLDPLPALLGALKQLEDHRQGRRSGAAVPAALAPQADRGEGRLDRVGGLAITHKSMMHLDWQLGIQQQDLLSE